MSESRPKIMPRPNARRASASQIAPTSPISGFASNLNTAITQIKSCDPNVTARARLLFSMITDFCDPVLAMLMGDVDSQPLTLSHHKSDVTDLQALEIRQDLLEEIIANTKSEAKSRAFLKRHQGNQLAILAVPCRTKDEAPPFAILAIAIEESRSHVIRETLEFVEAIARMVLDFREAPKTNAQPESDHFERLVKASSYENETSLAFQIVNAVATKFHCEQVSLGLAQRTGVHLIAISGTSSIKRNSPGTILLEQAMDECFDQRELVAFPRLKTNDNSAACGVHQALSKASGQTALCSLPITVGENCVAVLNLRRANGDTFSEEELQRLQERLLPCGPALQTLARASRSLKSHAKDAIAETGKNLLNSNTKIAAACLLIGSLTWLIFGKTVYEPSCVAELAAAKLQHIAAPLDGVIKAVHVHSGDMVHAGKPLVEFDTSSMLLEKKMLQADIGEATVDMKVALSQNDPKSAALQQAKIDAILAKLESVDARLAQATVTTPSQGRVVRCDLNSKVGQEFRFGAPLLELSLDDAWKIRIEVPDTVAPYVAPGQRGYFAPYGRPGESFAFTIEGVNGSADVKNGKNIFVADAKLELESDPTEWMKVGMSGVAKIATESRPVYWVYFHDALDWFHKTIWY